ncbi:ATP-binding protein [Pedobacter changchengzhani]|nr:sensor histidine kinase [Pedobacter changchengzhani]
MSNLIATAQKKSVVDSLNKILSLNNPKDVKYINALNSLAYLFAKTDSAKAMNFAMKAKNTSQIKKYTLGLADAYKAIGVVNSYKNRTDVAIQNFNISNEYYTQLKNNREIAGNYNNMGIAYKLVGNLEKGLFYLLKAEKLHSAINDSDALGVDLSNIGAVYSEMGMYNKAIEYYFSSIKLAEKSKKTKAIAQTYINIGNIMRLQKNFRAATPYFEKAVKVFTDYNDQLNLGIAHLNNANVYIEQSAYGKGIEQINKSLDAFKKVGFKRGIQICYNNLGALYMRQEKYKEAIPYLEKSISLATEAKNFTGLALVQQNIGFSYTKLGDLKLAEEWFDKAEVSAKLYSRNEVNTLSEILNHRSSLDSAKNDFQSAFMRRDKYRTIKDSLLNERLGKQINELNTKYETEKKQQQIVLLNNRNEIQFLALGKSELEIKNKTLENQRNVSEIGSQKLVLQKNKILITQKLTETRAKAQKIKLLASQNAVQKLEIFKKNIIVLTTLGSLIITILISYLIYNRYKVKQEKKLHAEIIQQQDLATKAVLNAEENERKRISGELHDGLGQMFSAVKLNLSAITEGLQFKDDASKAVFEKTLNLVDDSCREVRVISHQMAPNVLLKSGLTAAVRDFISKIDARKLKINLETFGLQERIDQNIETVLYRVIQESVNNVIKHSGANVLDIQLSKDEDGINVMIEDNGKGFDTSQLEKFQGIGLKNIRTRIEFLKGNVDFSSKMGAGTLIAIFIPCGNS